MSKGDILTVRRRSDAQPRALECDDNGALYMSGGGAAQDVRIVDDADDSCMDNANDALRVNVVAGGLVGAVTIADGADTAQGTTTDAEAVGAGTVIAILKRLRTLLSGALAVTGTFWQATQPVSGTFWQATQPVDTELAAAVALADAAANPTVPIVGAGEMLFNGTTWDRKRNNTEEVPFASAARTAGSWVDSVNYNARGAIITLNVTTKTGSPSIHLEVWIWDPSSNQRETLLIGAAVTAAGRHSYIVYPGCGPAANDIDVVAAYPLPRDWGVGMIHNNSDSITYSVGVMYIL